MPKFALQQRRLVAVSLAALVGTALIGAGAVHAQTFPSKPIRIVVPFAPGGGNDVFARQLATRMGELLKQQIVVDNRPGAGGTVGTDAAAKAAADGYTLLLGHTGTLAINPALYPKLPYDARNDFVAVGALASTPLVLVVPASGRVGSLAELLAQAKAAPGRLSYASSGNGTGGHLAGELLEEMTGVKLLHVPYKGTAPALTDVLGGQVDMMFSVLPPALPHLESGKLRALAVTGIRRSERLPQVPTVAESGVAGYESTLAYGLMAPRGVPEPVLKTLSAALAASLQSAALREAFRLEGAEPMTASAAAFESLMRAESEKWGRLIRNAGVKAD